MTWADVAWLLVAVALLGLILGVDLLVRRYWDHHTSTPEDDQ